MVAHLAVPWTRAVADEQAPRDAWLVESLRRVAVLAPMRSELRPILACLSNPQRRADGPDHVARIGRVDVVVALTGIGTQAATTTATRVLRTGVAGSPFDHLVVSGIAGAVPGRAEVGALVVPAVVVDARSGVELAAAPIGGVEPAGRLETSDEFHVDPGRIAELARRGVDALDMETAAIAAVCDAHDVAWTAFRGISDVAGETPPDVLGLVSADGSPNVGASARYLATHLREVPVLARLARTAARAARVAARAAVGAVGQAGAAR